MLPNFKQYKDIYMMNFSGSEQTYRAYIQTFDKLINFFDISPHEITKQDVLNFKSNLQIKYKKSSANQYLSVFRSIMNTFWESYSREIYKLDPSFLLNKDSAFRKIMFRETEVSNESHKEEKVITEEDLYKLYQGINSLNISDKQQLADIITLCYNTGLRINEVLYLTDDCYNYNGDIFDIYCRKTGKYRKIPVNNRTEGVLKRRLKSPDYLVTKKFTNKPVRLFTYSKTSFDRHLHEACRIAGIRKLNSHLFRKTFITKMALEKNMPSWLIAELVGHNSIKTTEKHYIIDKQKYYNQYI